MSTPSPFPASPTSPILRKFQDAPLYAILDTALGSQHRLADMAQGLLRAGVGVFQYRHKKKFQRRNFEECQELAVLIHQAGGVFLINDRADVAALCGADGVHLGQGDLPPVKAGQLLGEGKIIGYSTHTAQQARLADALPVDYIAIGPVFPTLTKQNPDPVVGVESVTELRKLTTKPLVAIGGITLESAPEVLQAGADAVAMAGDLFRDSNIEPRVRQFLLALPRGGKQ